MFAKLKSFFGAQDMTVGKPLSNIAAFSIPLLIGNLAHACGLIDRLQPISAAELAKEFCWNKVRKEDIYINQQNFY